MFMLMDLLATNAPCVGAMTSKRICSIGHDLGGHHIHKIETHMIMYRYDSDGLLILGMVMMKVLIQTGVCLACPRGVVQLLVTC